MTDRGTDDGVAFEDLPDDSKCPRCEQNKGKFNKAGCLFCLLFSNRLGSSS